MISLMRLRGYGILLLLLRFQSFNGEGHTAHLILSKQIKLLQVMVMAVLMMVWRTYSPYLAI
jgi:hypothetical protein